MDERKDGRIRLRPLNDEDWENYLTHVKEANEIYIQYGEQPSEDLFELIRTPTTGVLYCSIILKETNTMIGYVGITTWNNSLEFYVFKEYRRQGYGFEAVKSFIQVFFGGELTGRTEEKVTAETLRDNTASISFLEKLGFQKQAVGIRVDFSVRDSSATDLFLYSYEAITHTSTKEAQDEKMDRVDPCL